MLSERHKAVSPINLPVKARMSNFHYNFTQFCSLNLSVISFLGFIIVVDVFLTVYFKGFIVTYNIIHYWVLFGCFFIFDVVSEIEVLREIGLVIKHCREF